jgi:release factor glutamine methyltransferase
VNGPAAPASTSIAHALKETARSLSELTETPVLDAQVLLAHILDTSRSWLLAHPEEELTPKQHTRLTEKTAELQEGIPLPYVIGEWEFFGRKFQVNPSVLIPRPETEMMVEAALDWLHRHPDRRTAVDVGTGSGCVAVSLAVHQPDLKITAVEISPQAARTASKNIKAHQVDDQVKVVNGNLLDGVDQAVDLICANLPYIPTKTLKTLDVYKREPTLALDGGPEGLDPIAELIEQAVGKLTAGGLMLLEIEAGQSAAVEALASAYFPSARIQTLADLASHPRLVEIERQ